MLRWGILGTAQIAERRMMPALARHPAAELVAIGSRDPRRAARWATQHGLRTAGEYQRVLDDAAVDAVYLPLPNALHGDWIERSLRAGKDVLVEKPMLPPRLDRTELDTARELFALAADQGRTLMECMTFPRHRQHTAVRELVAAGAIGELRQLTVRFTIPERAPDDFRYRADLGGGALADLGCYALRAALFFLRPDLRVEHSRTRRDDRFPGVDLSGSARLRDGAGTQADLEFAIGAPYRCEYHLAGTEGSISVERAFTLPHDLAPRVFLDRAGDIQQLHLAPDDQFGNILTDFTAAHEGAQPGEHPDAAATLRTMELAADVLGVGSR
ncbi:gfo/Idh/MocA family oxidoreductase [Nocardia brasiliensis]|uniref:Gfo/Idh/MocA family oxidoreductase n=1 Tax=Nocardia brasiliensis TaxID=37326 RepID=A0A6G9XQU3_NOCBR|nr:Gfo/Idh/MocA family oxidoreductase [Nocardia brasiliensis]QIS03288.1 gfo/Idh/MocA family oxidoreductase [Nocardia brasiliensis]